MACQDAQGAHLIACPVHQNTRRARGSTASGARIVAAFVAAAVNLVRTLTACSGVRDFRLQQAMEHVGTPPTAAAVEPIPAEQIVSALSAVAATRHGQVQSHQQRDGGNSRAAADALRACVHMATHHSSVESAAFWLSFLASGGLDALFSALSCLPSDDKPRAVEAAVRLVSVSQANGDVEDAVRDWMPRAPQYLSEAYLEVQLQPAAIVGESRLRSGVGRRGPRCDADDSRVCYDAPCCRQRRQVHGGTAAAFRSQQMHVEARCARLCCVSAAVGVSAFLQCDRRRVHWPSGVCRPLCRGCDRVTAHHGEHATS